MLGRILEQTSDKLAILKYEGPHTKEERMREVILTFQQFRRNWETWAEENGYQYLLVGDGLSFDAWFINALIVKYLPSELPLPYSASTQKFSPLVETSSEQKGLLMAVDPSFSSSWGLSSRINELFKVPSQEREHDHNPANDAYSIAFDQQVLFGIQDGKIERRV